MTKLTLPPALPCSIKDKRKEINGEVGWDRLRKGKEQFQFLFMALPVHLGHQKDRKAQLHL